MATKKITFLFEGNTRENPHCCGSTLAHLINTNPVDETFSNLIKNSKRVAIIIQSLHWQVWAIVHFLYRNKSIAIINPAMPKQQIEVLLKECDIAVVITDLEYVFGEGIQTHRIPEEGIESFITSGERTDTGSLVNELNGGHSDIIVFSSGSSGKPKAVQLSPKQFNTAYHNSKKLLGYSHNDVWLLSLPLHHVSGFSILYRALCSQAEIIIPPSISNLELESALKKYPVTHLSLVPKQLQFMITNKIQPPSTLKITLLGGAASENDLVHTSIATGWKTAKVYGSSETAAFITILFPENFYKKPDSVGKPLPNVSFRTQKSILSSNGEYEEIVVKSDSLAKGYLNDKVQSEEKFVKGEYYTGDAGYIDEEGFLFIKSRLDNVINTGGNKVYPEEINSALKSIISVLDCVTIGIPDKEWGSVVGSLIIIKPGFVMNEQNLRLLLREKLTPFQIPKVIRFTENLPYNVQGKIDNKLVLQILVKSI